jgi:O-antigen/teichoic acid export membrane protein
MNTVKNTAVLRLNNTLRDWLRRAEVDRAVIFGVLTKVWQIFVGPITLLLIAWHMTPEVQGFYYSFASLLALQSFLELSLSVVIMNFASHEWAFLNLNDKGLIIGQADSLSRLVSLGRFAFKWYAIASALFVVGVGVGGYLFFSQDSYRYVEWQGPWFSVVFLTGLALFALPFNALLEGCNQVETVQKFRFSYAILSSLVLWLMLMMDAGLWAAVASAIVMVLRDCYLSGIKYRRFFKQFFTPPNGPTVQWWADIWPMQWRLAISNIGNYFAFSLFTPVMFHYHGPIVAGQMGMTWTLVLAVQSIGVMWIYPKVPGFGMLIAGKDYTTLDRLWYRTSFVSLVVVSLGVGVIWFAIYVMNTLDIEIAARLLPPLPTGILSLAVISLQIMNCYGMYLRAHKKEPFVFVGIVGNLLIGLLVWILGRQFGPLGAAAGFFGVAVCIIVPWETVIWNKCRIKWH